MKKLFYSLGALAVLSAFLVMPTQTQAATCNTTVVDVKDYTVKITTDVYFRKTIQGGEDEECPESEVLGSFSNGQVLWVLGEIQTGVLISEDPEMYGSWLYVKHPKTGDYGFVWSKNTETIDPPQDQQDHEEVVIEAPEMPQVDADKEKECVIIGEVKDYYIKTTDSLNVRNGVCNGEVLKTLDPETIVKVIGTLGEWFYIEIPGGGKGFVHSDYTEVVPTPEGREDEPEVTIGPDDKGIIGPEPKPESSGSGTLKDIIGYKYEQAIRYLEQQQVVEGYPDGLFKAEIPVNRAEFTKIVVGAKLKSEPFSSAADCFPDVAKTAWYSSYVCYAKDSHIIDGYPDGTFKPGDNVEFVEAAKILANTFDLPVEEAKNLWYQPFVEVMQKNNYIPATIKQFNQEVNRGEMSEWIWRIMQKVTDKSSTQFNFETNEVTTTDGVDSGQTSGSSSDALAMCMDKHLPDTVDMAKVRNAWLGWTNDTRTALNLNPFVMQEGLNYSSSLWAKNNDLRDTSTHSRETGTTSDWFKEIGLTFKFLGGSVYAENVGVADYACAATDCTDSVITAAKTVFDGYLAQKGTTSSKDYDKLVIADLKELGLGLSIDAEHNKLYLVSHMAQAVDTYPTSCQ